MDAFPQNSDPVPLTLNDIVTTDSILKVAVDSFNKTNSRGLYESFNKQVPIEIFIINLKKYKKQYFPYRDVNGQKIIYIICFCDEFKAWKNEIYSGRLHSGICNFNLKVNLSEKNFNYLLIGGYG